MKKIIITLLLMLMFIFNSNNAKAQEYNIPYGTWSHVEVDALMDTPVFPVPYKYTKIKVEIQNMDIKLGETVNAFPNNDIEIRWDSLGQHIVEYVWDPGNTSFTQEFKTGQYKENKLYISSGARVESFSFDIRITNLGIYYNEDEADKVSGEIEQQDTCYSNKCKVQIDTTLTSGVKKVQLYRKSSKNGKYKLVKTFSDGSDLDYFSIVDKGLKSNKKYWYKIKVLGWYSKIWSDYSKAKVYWTCPKKVKGKKSNGNTVTWKKLKGVSGYIVDLTYDEFAGYNIFGQRLVDVYRKSYFVKDNKYKINKKDASVAYVRGYVKHDGRYYCSDGQVVKKKKDLKDNDVSRYRE